MVPADLVVTLLIALVITSVLVVLFGWRSDQVAMAGPLLLLSHRLADHIRGRPLDATIRSDRMGNSSTTTASGWRRNPASISCLGCFRRFCSWWRSSSVLS